MNHSLEEFTTIKWCHKMPTPLKKKHRGRPLCSLVVYTYVYIYKHVSYIYINMYHIYIYDVFIMLRHSHLQSLKHNDITNTLSHQAASLYQSTGHLYTWGYKNNNCWKNSVSFKSKQGSFGFQVYIYIHTYIYIFKFIIVYLYTRIYIYSIYNTHISICGMIYV